MKKIKIIFNKKDALFVNGGSAIKNSYGINVGNELITPEKGSNIPPIELYTSKDSNVTVEYSLTPNCVVHARGGKVENYSFVSSYGISCNTARLSGGTINAYGGKVSYEGIDAGYYNAATYGIRASLLNISGATVTAKGGAFDTLSTKTKSSPVAVKEPDDILTSP